MKEDFFFPFRLNHNSFIYHDYYEKNLQKEKNIKNLYLIKRLNPQSIFIILILNNNSL